MSIATRELWRKSVHLSGVFFLPLLLWRRDLFVALLGFFLIVYLFVELSARQGLEIPLLSALTSKCKRPSEKGQLSQGALLLVLAGILTPYLFGPTIAALALAQAFVADTFSTWVGMTVGKTPLPYARKKTWAGSLTFWTTSFLISLYFVSWPEALLLGFVGAAVESLPLHEMDNLTVPLAVGVAAALIGV